MVTRYITNFLVTFLIISSKQNLYSIICEMTHSSDKQVEHDRYEIRASSILACSDPLPECELPLELQSPYKYFAKLIGELSLSPNSRVLEIGAGTGALTTVLLKTGAFVIASDISVNSLRLLFSRLKSLGKLKTQVADMECLPFGNEEFDLVTSAGSLSYGDSKVVMQEIYRVLKPGSAFVCVDSLNHNPIYRVNRWVQYLQGKRTKSTMVQMPTVSTMQRYKSKFGEIHVKFFGSLVWLSPFLRLIFGTRNTAIMIDAFDSYITVRRSAFKFVMIAVKRI